MKLNYEGLKDTAAWEAAGVKLPEQDWKAMCEETRQNPVWVHFGAGNISRIFIACDTSQKIPIRFGETIKSYMADPEKDPADLTAIPLALAGWLRYLMGVDDEGKAMEVSPDPMLAALQEVLAGIEPGRPETVGDRLTPVLANPNLFGVSLIEAGLADKVTGFFTELIAGPGAVRSTLRKYLA